MERKAYPSDVSDEEWALVAPYLTLMTEDAPQREYPLREVFNGLLMLRLQFTQCCRQNCKEGRTATCGSQWLTQLMEWRYFALVAKWFMMNCEFRCSQSAGICNEWHFVFQLKAELKGMAQ